MDKKKSKTKKKREEKPRFSVTNNEYLNVKEAACFVGLTLNYFYKLTAKHEVPYYLPTGRKMLFKRSELQEWIERSRVATNEELLRKVLV